MVESIRKGLHPIIFFCNAVTASSDCTHPEGCKFSTRNKNGGNYTRRASGKKPHRQRGKREGKIHKPRASHSTRRTQPHRTKHRGKHTRTQATHTKKRHRHGQTKPLPEEVDARRDRSRLRPPKAHACMAALSRARTRSRRAARRWRAGSAWALWLTRW